MKCKNCGSEIADDAIFCGECGNKVEKHNTCKNCGSELKDGALFCVSCGKPVNSDGIGKPENLPDKNGKMGKEKVVLVVAVLILAFSVSILAGFFFLNSGSDKKAEPVETQKTLTETKKPETTEDPEETPVPEETEEPEETPKPKKTPKSSNKTAKDSGEFPYRFNQYAIIEHPTYTRIYNDDYSYYCAVPEHFVFLDDGAYYAPDNTALMTVTADVNFEDLSVNQAMYRYIAEIGGEVSYSATGDTWFAISIEKDGISYYRKCYVDHYIRAFSFSFPKEYLDIYDKYINYIEDNFKRTDV